MWLFILTWSRGPEFYFSSNLVVLALLSVSVHPPTGLEPLVLLRYQGYLSCQHSYCPAVDLYSFHSFWLDGPGIVNQTRNLVAKPGTTRAVHRLLPVCCARCRQRGRQGLVLLMPVCTEDEEGFFVSCLSRHTQKCFQDPSVVKSAMHNYTSKHNVPRQICPISKRARMEVKTGVSYIGSDCLHVWLLWNYFLITLKGCLQQRGREKAPRGSWGLFGPLPN